MKNNSGKFCGLLPEPEGSGVSASRIFGADLDQSGGASEITPQISNILAGTLVRSADLRRQGTEGLNIYVIHRADLSRSLTKWFALQPMMVLGVPSISGFN